MKQVEKAASKKDRVREKQSERETERQTVTELK